MYIIHVLNIYLHIYTCMYVSTCVYVHYIVIYMYRNMYIPTYIYMYICTCFVNTKHSCLMHCAYMYMYI